MNIDRKKLEAAWKDKANWSVLDQTLYDLCKKYPGHEDVAGSNAKLWLIGRGFATGIERQVKSTGGQGSSMLSLCEFIHKSHKRIEVILAPLRAIKEPLTPGDLRVIVEQHGRFCGLLEPVVRGTKPRSFAAKYLHFHCPAIPIYDNVATEALSSLGPWRDDWQLFKKPPMADEWYYWFVLRFWQFYQEAKKIRKDVTVRFLDQFLLWG